MRRHQRALPGLIVATALTLLGGCGGDDEDVEQGTQPIGTEPTAADCSEVITDDVISTLGWTPDQAATVKAGRCERLGDGGQVTVRTEALVDKVDDVYEAACTQLRSDGAIVVEPVGFVEAASSCAAIPSESTGVSTLYFVSDDKAVVQIRVAADKPVDPGALKNGLAELADSAEGQF